MRKRIGPIAIIIVLLGLGYFGWRQFAPRSSTASSEHFTVAVTRGAIQVSISGTGAAYPSQRRDVRAAVTGEVRELPVRTGDRVSAGTVLAVMYSEDIETKATDARDEFRQAEDRAREALLLGAGESVDNPTRYFERLSRVGAPISGRVTSLRVSPGEQVRQGQIVAVIVDDTALLFKTRLLQSEAEQLTVGDVAQVWVRGFTVPVEATVTRISEYPVSDGTSWWTPVELTIDGNTVLTAGMTGTLSISPGGSLVQRPGTLAIAGERTVTAPIAAEIKDIQVREGDGIRAGEDLLTFTSASINSLIETQRLNLDRARSKLESAVRGNDTLTLTSPIDGVVLELGAAAGDRLDRNGMLAVIADIDHVEIVIDIDELDIARLEIGQTAEVSVNALPGREFTGEITAIDLAGRVRESVTTYGVRIRVPNPEGVIRSGMTATASVVTGRRENVLVAPVEAVQTVGNRRVVQVLVNGAVEMRPIRTGLVGPRTIEIVEGLSEGDQLVVSGSSTVNSVFPGGMMPGGFAPGEGVRIMPGGGTGVGRTRP